MKQLKRRWSAALGALLLILTLVAALFQPIAVFAAEDSTLVIHYHRFDESYDGWNFWLWPENGDGGGYSYTGTDDYGPYAEVTFPGSPAKVGIIVRLNEWEKKDFDADRFIDMGKAADGTLHVYLVQGDGTIYYDKNEVDLSAQFLSASFPTAKEIEFTVTVPIDTSAADEVSHYRVKDEKGVEYPIMKIWSADGGQATTASVILEEKIDLGHSYTLERDDYGSIPVSVGGAFSTTDFETAYTYEGNDLGANYSKEATSFRVWAPTASKVTLNLYEEGLGGEKLSETEMTKDQNGTWITTVTGDLNGKYYTYTAVTALGTNEAVDPYARSAGANGQRGMILDLATTNPEGWDNDKKPAFLQMTDAVIYELHVRDLSSHASSGVSNVGKFLEFTETGTKNADGLSTGIDHLKELGITHLHLLPSFDYASVDETKLDTPQFNWGYDPQNYNVPEGSYSTDPYHGEVRVKEMKEAVKALHQNGIRVVMDVVYNHTAATVDSNFNKLVPDYYYRKDGSVFSNGSGCGNETASDRSMVRKFIVDSVVYWAKEYHIDGFRFDLMALHDIETMNAVRAALNEIDPSILIYGEGWTAGGSPLLESNQSLKANIALVDGVAAFSDDLRDGIKGSVFEAEQSGFVSGATGLEESIKFGVVASTNHPQLNYSLVNYSDTYWANSPAQCINYASAHDNLTLWDKLATSNANDSEADRIAMNKLSAAIVFTSQGIPFFQAGEELLRSKPKEDGTFDENSYQSPDTVNAINWERKTKYQDVFNYYQGLIAFRKKHPSLRMTSTEDIAANLVFAENTPENVVAYQITGKPNQEQAEGIYVIHNASRDSVSMKLPKGTWNVYIDGKQAGTKVLSTIKNGTAEVAPISTMVLVQETTSSSKTGLWVGIGAVIVAAAAIAVVVKTRKKKA